MSDYHFVTRWRVHAPAEEIFDALIEVEHWPEWWSTVARVERLDPGDADGIGARYRYSFTTRLPYTLTFELRTLQLDYPTFIEIEAAGELVGKGIWRLAPRGGITDVQYDWIVRTTKRWMNLIAPIARPLFEFNHDAVMHDGARGLASLLDTEVEEVDTFDDSS